MACSPLPTLSRVRLGRPAQTLRSLALGCAMGMAAAPAPATVHPELAAPFCYFSAPTDQIGFKGCPKATIVT